MPNAEAPWATDVGGREGRRRVGRVDSSVMSFNFSDRRREKIELLNNLTDIITAWEESPRPTVQEVRERFPAHHFR